MSDQRIQLGQLGEDAAIAFLKKQGYSIFQRNFRNNLGEIDIIAKDRDAICFIEVKTRRTDTFGSPFESITPAKKKKITYVAMSYLKSQEHCEANVRFDVVSVLMKDDEDPHVEIIKNAFEAN